MPQAVKLFCVSCLRDSIRIFDKYEPGDMRMSVPIYDNHTRKEIGNQTRYGLYQKSLNDYIDDNYKSPF